MPPTSGAVSADAAIAGVGTAAAAAPQAAAAAALVEAAAAPLCLLKAAAAAARSASPEKRLLARRGSTAAAALLALPSTARNTREICALFSRWRRHWSALAARVGGAAQLLRAILRQFPWCGPRLHCIASLCL